jgi:hypothetical protein
MDDTERWVAEYFGGLGLTGRPFDKAARRLGRTPDFRVCAGARLLFFCEVKSTHGAARTGQGELVPAQVAHARERVRNRLATHIHTAVKQFDAVNPGLRVPNVLAFVNHDPCCRFGDMVAAVTHGASSPDASGAGCECAGVTHALARIHEERRRIHLYLWFDDGRGPHLVVNADRAHRQLLTGVLQIGM